MLVSILDTCPSGVPQGLILIVAALIDTDRAGHKASRHRLTSQSYLGVQSSFLVLSMLIAQLIAEVASESDESIAAPNSAQERCNMSRQLGTADAEFTDRSQK